MAKGVVFVAIYSLVLIVLFILFSYLMTTIDPKVKPHSDDYNVPTTTASTKPTSEKSTAVTTTTIASVVRANAKDVSLRARTSFHTRRPTHARAPSHTSSNKFKYPVKSKGQKRKENIIAGTTETVRSHYLKIVFSRRLPFLYRTHVYQRRHLI